MSTFKRKLTIDWSDDPHQMREQIRVADKCLAEGIKPGELWGIRTNAINGSPRSYSIKCQKAQPFNIRVTIND